MSILTAAQSGDSGKPSKKMKRKHSTAPAGGEETKKYKKEKNVLKSKNTTNTEKEGKSKNFKKEKLSSKITDKKS